MESRTLCRADCPFDDVYLSVTVSVKEVALVFVASPRDYVLDVSCVQPATREDVPPDKSVGSPSGENRWQAKKHYGLEDGFVMLQGAFTHPESRSKGHFKRFLEHAMAIADDNDGYITAVCRPFRHSSEELEIQPPSLKQIAMEFTLESAGLRYEQVTNKEGKEQQ